MFSSYGRDCGFKPEFLSFFRKYFLVLSSFSETLLVLQVLALCPSTAFFSLRKVLICDSKRKDIFTSVVR